MFNLSNDLCAKLILNVNLYCISEADEMIYIIRLIWVKHISILWPCRVVWFRRAFEIPKYWTTWGIIERERGTKWLPFFFTLKPSNTMISNFLWIFLEFTSYSIGTSIQLCCHSRLFQNLHVDNYNNIAAFPPQSKSKQVIHLWRGAPQLMIQFHLYSKHLSN